MDDYVDSEGNLWIYGEMVPNLPALLQYVYNSYMQVLLTQDMRVGISKLGDWCDIEYLDLPPIMKIAQLIYSQRAYVDAKMCWSTKGYDYAFQFLSTEGEVYQISRDNLTPQLLRSGVRDIQHIDMCNLVHILDDDTIVSKYGTNHVGKIIKFNNGIVLNDIGQVWLIYPSNKGSRLVRKLLVVDSNIIDVARHMSFFDELSLSRMLILYSDGSMKLKVLTATNKIITTDLECPIPIARLITTYYYVLEETIMEGEDCKIYSYGITDDNKLDLELIDNVTLMEQTIIHKLPSSKSKLK